MSALTFDLFKTVLSFGPDLPVRYNFPTFVPAEFEAFEAEFAAYVEQAREFHALLPGNPAWGFFMPTREKLLEYFLTLRAIDFSKVQCYLDIASCTGLFPAYVLDRFSCKVLRQDLYYAAGSQVTDFTSPVTGSPHRVTTIGCDACELPVEDESIDVMTLHCSFEHFEGDADRNFIREAHRVLRPGGSVLIIPFYCGGGHQEVITGDRSVGCQYNRYYSPATFRERVLAGVEDHWDLMMTYYETVAQYDPQFYCAYSMMMTKR